MKLVVFGAVALLVGLLAGTGVAAFKVKGELLAAHSKESADSSAAAAQASDFGISPEEAFGDDSTSGSEANGLGTDGSVAVTVPDTAAPSQTTSTPTKSSATKPSQTKPSSTRSSSTSPSSTKGAQSAARDSGGSARTPSAPAVDSTAPPASSDSLAEKKPLNEEGAKKLAKIFAAMKPADAAKVLSKMSDEEVKAIVMHMAPRVAGQVVGSFEPTRAAALSKIVLQDQPVDSSVGGS